MNVRAAALLAVTVALLPASGRAQEFPPASEAERITFGDPPRKWRVPIGVGLAYGWPGGNVTKGFSMGDAFGAGSALRLDAGLAYETFGLSFVYRGGNPSAGKTWCPAGQSCDASWVSKGVAFTVSPGVGDPTPVHPYLMIGGGVADGTVSSGGVTSKLTGWEMFVSLFIGGKIGGRNSLFKLGGYADFHIFTPTRYETAAGKTTLAPEDTGTPIWFDLGIRAAFD